MTARSHGPDDAAASALGRLLHAGSEEGATSVELERLLDAVREIPASPARPMGRIVALAAAVFMLAFAIGGVE